MIKECVVLNGKILNIGPWDYQYIEVDGEPVAQNPLPEGAVIEERDFEYDPDRGWYEPGTMTPPSIEQRLQAAEDALTALLGL